MINTKDMKEKLEKQLDLGIHLAKIQGSIEFLHYMNTKDKDSPRTLTEEMTTKGLLEEVAELRSMIKEIQK